MDWPRLALGSAMVVVALVLLAGTRWGMRRGSLPVQQVALIAPLCAGTVALIGGVGLLMTASWSA